MPDQFFRRCFILLVAGLACSSLTACDKAATPAAAPLLKQAQAVVLPDVKGGFDLMAIDLARRRLMVNAEDNGTTEVVDVAGKGSRIATIPGMHQPKWVAYRPELGKVYVANGDGVVRVLRSNDYAPLGAIRFDMLANNLRYDAASTSLFVGLGDDAGAIAIIDAKSDRVRSRIPLDAHPKQFELDGDRLYANIPSKQIVQVVNWKTEKTVARWPACRTANIPMALDARDQRLFVGCEEGALRVLDTRSGQPVASVTISTGADGIYHDEAHGLLYVSAAEGFVDVIRQVNPNRYRRLTHIPTRPGAATSLFVPAMHRLFVALPQTAAAPAEIRSYATP